MKVVLPEQLFSAAAIGRDPFLLVGLFGTCLARSHTVLTEFETTRSPLFSQWRTSLPRDQQEMVDWVLRESNSKEARESFDGGVIATDSASDWTSSPPRIGPDDLIDLLRKPLTILVEHEVNDGAFLKAVAFAEHRRTFARYCERDLIRFEHGGGSSMLPLLKERAKDRPRAHRMWAIFDSDALVPNTPTIEAQDKVAACRDAKIRHHLLHRRAIENYLPPDELNGSIPVAPKHLRDRRAVGAFGRLSPAQRAHYNMKDGFNGDSARLGPNGKDAQQSAAVSQLFADVQTADREALARGFGKDIAELFAIAPDLGRPGISEESRRRDGQDAEMIPLFRDILRWL